MSQALDRARDDTWIANPVQLNDGNGGKRTNSTTRLGRGVIR